MCGSELKRVRWVFEIIVGGMSGSPEWFGRLFVFLKQKGCKFWGVELMRRGINKSAEPFSEAAPSDRP